VFAAVGVNVCADRRSHAVMVGIKRCSDCHCDHMLCGLLLRNAEYVVHVYVLLSPAITLWWCVLIGRSSTSQ
jgi:hypothetical protein